MSPTPSKSSGPRLAEVLASLSIATDLGIGHCEVVQRLAERLGLDRNVIYSLGQLYERWDGKGLPRHIKGENIAPAVLVATLAQDMVLFHRLGGLNASLNTARDCKGRNDRVVVCLWAREYNSQN